MRLNEKMMFFVGLFNLLVIMIILAHILGIFWYLIAVYEIKNGDEFNWIYTLQIQDKVINIYTKKKRIFIINNYFILAF
jgi:hypothetical protein